MNDLISAAASATEQERHALRRMVGWVERELGPHHTGEHLTEDLASLLPILLRYARSVGVDSHVVFSVIWWFLDGRHVFESSDDIAPRCVGADLMQVVYKAGQDSARRSR